MVMGVTLNESEWMLGDVRFGTINSSRLAIESMDFGEFTIDTGDTNDPYGAGVVPGVDIWRGATISFTVYTAFADDEVEAFNDMRPLVNVWASGANLKPKETMPLRFCAGGRQLVLYGRPRRFTQPIPDIRSKRGKVKVVLDFLVMDPNVYQVGADGSDGISATFKLLHANEQGGVIWPAEVPYWWDGEYSTETKDSILNPSPTSTPFKVTIHGPIVNPTIRTDDWYIEFTGRGGLTIPYDRAVVVDTRAGTARWADNNTTVASYLSRRSHLNSRLAPGRSTIWVGGSDQSNTSSFTVTWSIATPTI